MFGSMPTMKSDNSKYYGILGVSKTASQDEIKKAYKRAALANYPDKGGDPEKFKEISQAYEVLSDPENRDVYDSYGEDALKEGMGGGGVGPFGGWPFSSSSGRARRKGDDVVHILEVSLEELYNGTSKKLSVTRNVICSMCKGKGSKTGASSRCASCQGLGYKVLVAQINGLMLHRREECPDCEGSGERIPEKDRCGQCKGQKVVEENEELEVHIKKGMRHGQTLVFRGQAHEAPDATAGDLRFLLQQEAHPMFKRIGDDLLVEHTLSLTEALCGFQFPLTHLDGRKLLIKSAPGQIIKPDEYKAINDEGMPHYTRPFTKGRLHLRFSVAFPESGTLSLDQIKTFEAVLPPRAPSQMSETELDECEETTLHDVNIQSHAQEAYKEEEEEAFDIRSGCAQQ